MRNWLCALAMVAIGVGCNGGGTTTDGSSDARIDATSDLGVDVAVDGLGDVPTDVNPCGTGLAMCGTRCVATDVDPDHCGSCSTVCAAGERCVTGSCQPSCPNGQMFCAGSDAGGGV